MKTIAEQIRDLENTRAAKAARMTEVMQKSIDEGRSTDAAESEEFDTLEMEIKQVDEDLVRLNKLNVMNAQSAKPVDPAAGKSVVGASAARSSGPMIITKKTDPLDKFEGQAFTRIIIAKTLGKLLDTSPINIAQQRWGKSNPNLVEFIKADVAGGGSGSGEWGAELVSETNYMADFIEYLYGMTVYNRLPLREVPANITIKGQDGAATAYWTGESKSAPVTTLDFNDVTLTPLKVTALAVISKELMRDSSHAAEMLVRDGLMEAAAQKIDGTFLSTTGATAGSTPAGILHNAFGTDSAGTDYDSILNDLKELDARFITARNTSGQFIYVMNPLLASSMSFIRNALDQQPFGTLNAQGGTMAGQTVLTGDNVNSAHLIKLKPSDIYKIGSGAVEVSVSDQASIEMANNPAGASDGPTAATGKVVSMFQTESVAIKVVQSMNFAKRRNSAVAFINNAAYGSSVST